MSNTVIVLFNLKNDADQQSYEHWAKNTDLPTVKGLASIDDFSVFKSAGLLGSDATPPYQYVEVIQVNDMETFGKDVATEVMQKVAAEFQGFADNPVFILSNPLE